MFSVDQAPRYVRETQAAAARLQEMTSPERYDALVGRAERMLEGLFTVETNVEPELQAKIAIRERFDSARAKQAILMVATWRLVRDLAEAWGLKKRAVPAPVRSLATTGV